MMMRNCFVREEGNTLVIGSGLRSEWVERGETFGIERTFTPFGEVSVEFTPHGANELELNIDAQWRTTSPKSEVQVPGYRVVENRGLTVMLRR